MQGACDAATSQKNAENPTNVVQGNFARVNTALRFAFHDTIDRKGAHSLCKRGNWCLPPDLLMFYHVVWALLPWEEDTTWRHTVRSSKLTSTSDDRWAGACMGPHSLGA